MPFLMENAEALLRAVIRWRYRHTASVAAPGFGRSRVWQFHNAHVDLGSRHYKANSKWVKQSARSAEDTRAFFLF